MKWFLWSGILGVFMAWAFWRASLSRLWRSLGAVPVGELPVWRQVRGRLEELARRERLPAPQLWILPDFSPNALVLRGAAGVEVALTEGLLRILDQNELDAVLLLCLAHGGSRRRFWQSALALQLYPFSKCLQTYPVPVQIFLSPWLTILMRFAVPPASILRLDSKVPASQGLSLASAIQKMAVAGRKIPFRAWNFALDPFFLLSPLALDGGPFWVFLSQPPVEQRRQRLLDSAISSPASTC